MNFTKNFKWQLVLVALGASLVLTNKVYSQEIDNTEFNAPTTSIGSNFNTAAPTAVNTTAADPQQVAPPAASAAIPAANQLGELGATSLSLTAGPLLAIAIVALACIAVKKISAKRLENRNASWKSRSARKTPVITNKSQVLQS